MQTPRRKRHALTHPASHLRLWLTLAVGLAADLATKSLAWSTLGGPPEDGGRHIEALAGWLRLVASRNPGIVFGIDPSAYFGAAGPLVTALLALATCVLIFVIFQGTRPRQWMLHLLCGLVLAGAVGNLYDRLAFDGHVRDFIQITADLSVGSLRLNWPYVFNLADVYLVAGVGSLAVFYLFLGGRDAPNAAPKRPAEPGRG